MQGSLKLPDAPSSNSFTASLLTVLLGTAVTVGFLLFVLAFRNSELGLYALGGLVAIVLTAVIFARPQLGAYILVITIATNLSTILTRNGYPSINKPIVAVVFVAIAANYLWNRRRFRGSLHLGLPELFLFLWGVVWFISSFGARNMAVAYEQVTDFFKNFIILLCMIYALRTPQQWQRAIWLLIGATAVPAMLGVYQVLTGNYTQQFGGLMLNISQQVVAGFYEVRLSGPINEPNFYGQILVFVLVLTVYRILDEKSFWYKLLAAASACCMVLTAVYTYSRGAFITMLVMVLLIAIERRVRLSLIATVCLLLLLLSVFLPSNYTERISSLELLNPGESFRRQIYQDASFRGRYSEMISGLIMFVEHPVLGVGIGNYDANYQDYASRLGLEYRFNNREAHSLYVETLAETGLLGFVSLSGTMAAIFMGLNKARRKIAQLPAYAHLAIWYTSVYFALVSYLISSLVLHGDFMRYLWLVMALAIGAVHLTNQIVQTQTATIETATQL